jgi:hypothetical protein
VLLLLTVLLLLSILLPRSTVALAEQLLPDTGGKLIGQLATSKQPGKL